MAKGKRGQETIEMSFGVIFSIFLVIAIIGVAIYVIIYFLNLGKCTDAGFYYEGLENKINEGIKASTGLFIDSYIGKVPSGIEKVCFGNLSLIPRPADGQYKQNLTAYRGNSDGNVFLYPPEKACDGNLFAKKIERIYVREFFCINVTSGRADALYLDKDYGGNLVNLCYNPHGC